MSLKKRWKDWVIVSQMGGIFLLIVLSLADTLSLVRFYHISNILFFIDSLHISTWSISSRSITWLKYSLLATRVVIVVVGLHTSNMLFVI